MTVQVIDLACGRFGYVGALTCISGWRAFRPNLRSEVIEVFECFVRDDQDVILSSTPGAEGFTLQAPALRLPPLRVHFEQASARKKSDDRQLNEQ